VKRLRRSTTDRAPARRQPHPGYNAQQTLDYLQLCMKRNSALPRTDSRYLTGDMEASVPALPLLPPPSAKLPRGDYQRAQVSTVKR
jgi:hypothetical protein